VPTFVLAKASLFPSGLSHLMILDKPKSPNLTLLLLSKKILLGFRSLCSILLPLIPLWWHSRRASNICIKIFQITSSATKSFSALHFLISYAMSPFSQYSITMKIFLFSWSTIFSMYLTILGCYRFFKQFISEVICARSFSPKCP